MTDQPRPPLWRAMNSTRIKATTFYRDDEGMLCEMPPDESTYANEIRAVADYLEAHGLINTISQPTLRSGPRQLALLEEEARRAEAGE